MTVRLLHVLALRVCWLLLASTLPCSQLLAGPTAGTRALIQEKGEPLPAGRVTGGVHVPLERAEGGDTPVLTFRSDRGPVRLLLDTGAASAMVTPALVRRLGLESRPLTPDRFSLAGGGESCPQLGLAKTRLPALRLGAANNSHRSFRLEGVEGFVLPVVALPPGIDGVLGAATLRQMPFGVDPLNGSVFFGGPALRWGRRMTPRPQVIPLLWQRDVPLGGIWAVSGPDGTVTPFDALIDTGAEGLFLTPEAASLLRPLGARQAASLVGVCGQQQVWRQRLMGIGMGPQGPAIQAHEAILTTNPVFAMLGVEAIVGQEFLRFRRQLWRLDLDPPRLELW